MRLPHPADFCLQKLIVAGQRKRSDKAEKDMQAAFNVLDAIIESEALPDFNTALKALSPKERNTVVKIIERSDYSYILKELEGK